MVEEINRIIAIAKDLVGLVVGLLTIAVLAKQLRKRSKTKPKRKRRGR
jgi:Na+/glutamate symporter